MDWLKADLERDLCDLAGEALESRPNYLSIGPVSLDDPRPPLVQGTIAP